MSTTEAEREPLLPKPSGLNAAVAQHEGPEISTSTRYSILAGLWTATWLSTLPAVTMVATLLPSITSEFKESNQASWLGTSYILSACTFTPLYGRLCTVVGRGVACQTALLAMATGTFLSSISGGMVHLTIARFLAGIGGGAISLLSLIVAADLYSIRDRGLPQAFTNISLGLGLGLGGPIGGLLNDLFGWRMAFLCQVPLFALAIVLVSKSLRYATPGQGHSAKEVLKRIDFGGCIALFFVIGSSLTWLSTKYNDDLPWTDTRVIVPLAISVISLALFVVIERYVAPEPVIPASLLTERVPVLVALSNYFTALCNFSVMYFLPLWFQTVQLDSASRAGLHLFPNSVAMALGALFAGHLGVADRCRCRWITDRTGKYNALNLVFGIFPLCGLVPMVFMTEDSGFVQKWFSVVPVGFGNAVVFQTVLSTTDCTRLFTEASIGFGTAFGQLFRSLGQVSAVAISSAVFQSRLDTELRQRIQIPALTRFVIADIRHSLTLVTTLPPDLQRAARDSYAASLRTIFVASACSTLMAYLVRLLVRFLFVFFFWGGGFSADRRC
ncbi:major facilitator superfamily domain-containing protein [Melanogaster broomeanus]|nr:major facilitator superfamily domain-containing protein [Melanogaster broomeanus]